MKGLIYFINHTADWAENVRPKNKNSYWNVQGAAGALPGSYKGKAAVYVPLPDNQGGVVIWGQEIIIPVDLEKRKERPWIYVVHEDGDEEIIDLCPSLKRTPGELAGILKDQINVPCSAALEEFANEFAATTNGFASVGASDENCQGTLMNNMASLFSISFTPETTTTPTTSSTRTSKPTPTSSTSSTAIPTPEVKTEAKTYVSNPPRFFESEPRTLSVSIVGPGAVVNEPISNVKVIGQKFVIFSSNDDKSEASKRPQGPNRF